MKIFNKIILIIVTVLFFNTCSSVDQNFLLFSNVNIVDTESGNILKDQDILVNKKTGLIEEIGEDISISKADSIIYLNSKFIIPGLWDMHTHVYQNLTDTTDVLSYTKKYLQLYLEYGVVGIRDMGGDINYLKSLKSLTNSTNIYPELILSGAPIVGARSRFVSHPQIKIETPAELDSVVLMLDSMNVDFIKVYDLFDESMHNQIRNFSIEQNLAIAGHLPALLNLEDIAKAGFSSFEHIGFQFVFKFADNANSKMNEAFAKWRSEGYNSFVSDYLEITKSIDYKKLNNFFSTISKNDIYWTPTLSVSVLPPATIENYDLIQLEEAYQLSCQNTLNDRKSLSDSLFAKYSEYHFSIIKLMRETGIRLLSGTDSPVLCSNIGESIHDELLLLTKAGLTPLEALQTATVNPSNLLGLENYSGKIEEETSASFIILNSNPLLDISNTKDIQMVINKGLIVER